MVGRLTLTNGICIPQNIYIFNLLKIIYSLIHNALCTNSYYKTGIMVIFITGNN